MKNLFIGDSMIKYLKEYVDVDLDVISCRGATVERLTGRISMLKKKYDWILVHVGTNNVSTDSVEEVILKYRLLANEILRMNPESKIIFSSIIPRDYNYFVKDYWQTDEHVKNLNCKIGTINKELEKMCLIEDAFVFCSSCKPSWRGFLANDGLHPNKGGNLRLANYLSGFMKGCISLDNASKKVKKDQTITSGYIPDATDMPSIISPCSNLNAMLSIQLPTSSCVEYTNVPPCPTNSMKVKKDRLKKPLDIMDFSEFPPLSTSKPVISAPRSIPASAPRSIPFYPVHSLPVLPTRPLPFYPVHSLPVLPTHSRSFAYSQPSASSSIHFHHSASNTWQLVVDRNHKNNKISGVSKNISPISKIFQGHPVCEIPTKNKFSVLTGNCEGENETIAKNGIASLNSKLNLISGGGPQISSYSKTCNSCGKTYLTKSSFSYHLKKYNCAQRVKNTYPKVCEACLKSYSSRSSFSNHLKRCKPKVHPILSDQKNKCTDVLVYKNSTPINNPLYSTDKCQTFPLKCLNCGRFYGSNESFKRHQHYCTTNKKQELYCTKCDKTFDTLWNLNDHLKTVHDITNVQTYSFNSMATFKSWLESETAATHTFLKKTTGKKVRGDKTYHYYSCQFYHSAYQSRIKSRVDRNGKRKNIKGVIPFNINCPVYICVCEQKNLISVTYYPVHNHRVAYENTKYHPLKESTRDLIKSYLLLSFPVSKIVGLIRGDTASRNNRTFHPTKEAFISRKTIQNYLNYLRNSVQPTNDAISVSCIVDELRKESYNPILIFKLQKSKTVCGPKYLDSLPNCETSFALGLQTEAQKDMLIKHSDKILCIDATHGTNFYDFYLLSLHIQDEYGQGYPVAHFITNDLDNQTLIALFSSLKYQIPDLKVNTVITDDDGCSFKAFNFVFGSNIKHLLCQWHVFRAWKRQLASKVHDKFYRQKMLQELLQIMNEKSVTNFENKLSMFLKFNSNKWQNFTEYFVKNYSLRKELWATCFRQFRHGNTNTNNYCESFHNQLKTIYFERKYNRRIDELVSTLLRMERDRFLKYSYNVTSNVPIRSEFSKIVKEKHNRGVKIQDADIREYDSHWEVESQTVKGKVYILRKIADVCALVDHCCFKCPNINCVALCSHLYHCSCEDSSNLCKHIHKVHMLSSETKICITDDFNKLDCEEISLTINSGILEQTLDVNALSSSESCRSKEAECKKLCSEILQLIENPQIKGIMLNNVVSCLNTLVSGMRGVLNLKNSTISVAPNQKINTRVKFFKTSQRKRRNSSFHANRSKTQKLNEDTMDEPNNHEQVDLKPNSDNCKVVNLNVFHRFSKSKSNDPTTTILTINNINLSYYMLKSLDPFVSVEEEKYLKLISPSFKKGWIYDSVIDAFNFVLTRKFKNYKAIDSLHSLLIFKQKNILQFPWIKEISSFEFLIIPVNLNCHWTLIIADIGNKILEYFDPLCNMPDSDTSTLIGMWCKLLNNSLSSHHHWQIVFPPHTKQIDNFNCGVFISYYVYQKLNKLSLTENLDIVTFRALMFSEITTDLKF